MAVKTFLELSTSHITKRDAQILEQVITDEFIQGGRLMFPRTCFKDDYGYIINTAGNTSSDYEEYRAAGMSENFISLLIKAEMEGHWYLRLDCDGEVDSMLPTFEW